MATCPSCGRVSNPAETCPHCGAHWQGRLSLRAFQILSLALAVLGLGGLWWFAVRSPTPTLKIGQAQAAMNLAYVRIAGQITRAPSLDPAGDYVSFWVADDTGELLVSAYRAVTQALLQSDRVPFAGDRVTLEGTLRVRPDSAALTLNAADALRIERPQPAALDIGRIDAQAALRAVTVRGQVRAVRSPYAGLTLVTLRDVTGAIDIAVPQAIQAQPGQSAEASGTVTLYKDTPQIALRRADALRVLPDAIPIAAPAHIAQLADRTGQWAAVRGSIVKAAPFSAGLRFTLDDGTGRADVVLWQDVYTALSPTLQLNQGAEVAVQGEVSLYRGAI